ncbi:hypothetical protein FQR65_LT11483 [Abscondita terminalis]|nr:hypothetical protein FQR65_LT11483 [Abscondita terminalis]
MSAKFLSPKMVLTYIYASGIVGIVLYTYNSEEEVDVDEDVGDSESDDWLGSNKDSVSIDDIDIDDFSVVSYNTLAIRIQSGALYVHRDKVLQNKFGERVGAVRICFIARLITFTMNRSERILQLAVLQFNQADNRDTEENKISLDLHNEDQRADDVESDLESEHIVQNTNISSDYKE